MKLQSPDFLRQTREYRLAAIQARQSRGMSVSHLSTPRGDEIDLSGILGRAQMARSELHKLVNGRLVSPCPKDLLPCCLIPIQAKKLLRTEPPGLEWPVRLTAETGATFRWINGEMWLAPDLFCVDWGRDLPRGVTILLNEAEVRSLKFFATRPGPEPGTAVPCRPEVYKAQLVKAFFRDIDLAALRKDPKRWALALELARWLRQGAKPKLPFQVSRMACIGREWTRIKGVIEIERPLDDPELCNQQRKLSILDAGLERLATLRAAAVALAGREALLLLSPAEARRAARRFPSDRYPGEVGEWLRSQFKRMRRFA